MPTSITPMTGDDLDFAVSMTDAENWGYLRSDFERLLKLAPEGCFVARGSLRRIGIITTSRHGDYGFLGTLIVMKNHRGSGVGKELFERALMYLRAQSVRSVELDGVFPAVNLYRRLGFRDKFLSLRFFRDPEPAAPPTNHEPAPISLSDLLHFDRELVKVDRTAVLSHFYQDFNDSLLISGNGVVNGYAFVRPRSGNTKAIGPLVARRPEDAVTLVRAAIARYPDRQLTIGVPESRRAFVQSLLEQGFAYRQPSLRMFFGEHLQFEDNVYGIISPEKG